MKTFECTHNFWHYTFSLILCCYYLGVMSKRFYFKSGVGPNTALPAVRNSANSNIFALPIHSASFSPILFTQKWHVIWTVNQALTCDLKTRVSRWWDPRGWRCLKRQDSHTPSTKDYGDFHSNKHHASGSVHSTELHKAFRYWKRNSSLSKVTFVDCYFVVGKSLKGQPQLLPMRLIKRGPKRRATMTAR